MVNITSEKESNMVCPCACAGKRVYVCSHEMERKSDTSKLPTHISLKVIYEVRGDVMLMSKLWNSHLDTDVKKTHELVRRKWQEGETELDQN